jgi:hypothetical protein
MLELVCYQEEETIDHLLVAFVFVRQFLSTFLRQFNLQLISPQPEDSLLLQWWDGKKQVGSSWDRLRKGLIHSSSWEPVFFGSIEINACLMLLP